MKTIKHIFSVLLIYTIVTQNFTSAATTTSTPPVVNITGNNLAGQMTLGSSDTLSLNISMNPGSKSGTNADWWLVGQESSSGIWYSYVYQTGWVYSGTNSNNLTVAYQGSLSNLPPYQVYNGTLPVGTYTIYVGFDTNMNGLLDTASDTLTYNTLNVTVLSSSVPASTINLPLYAIGNIAGRGGLFMTVSTALNDPSTGTTSSYASTPTNIIVDTGSSDLNLPSTLFNFPGGVIPAYVKNSPAYCKTYEGFSLSGYTISNVNVTLGSAGVSGQSLAINNAPIHIINQTCSGSCGSQTDCKSPQQGNGLVAGLIGVNYQDAGNGNVFRMASAPYNSGFTITTTAPVPTTKATIAAASATVPIGSLNIGNPSTAAYKMVQLNLQANSDTFTNTYSIPFNATSSVQTAWSPRLPGACITIGNNIYSTATTTTTNPSNTNCQANAVVDSGGGLGYTSFPGSLPSGLGSTATSTTIQIPGIFSYNYDSPAIPQPNGGINNITTLFANSGIDFFNYYNVYLNPVSGQMGFMAK